MPAFDEDERPKKTTAHQIGQDLSQLSIEEIDARVALLKDEIERLTVARAAKKASRSAADAFFKPQG